MLNELHIAHMGIVRVKALARSFINVSNELIGKECIQCLENASNLPKVALHVWCWPEKPNERLHVDFLGPLENSMYIVIIDAHSKWIDIREMVKITAEKTIEVLRDYFAN